MPNPGKSSTRLAVIVVAALAADVASGDEIVVEGDKLRGKVVTVTTEAVVFETVYGKGNVEVPLEKIQSLSTEKEYVFVHGEDDSTQGRIVGVEQGVVVVGVEGAEPVRVPASEIALVTSREEMDESVLVAAKTKLRYWTGNVDVGFSMTQSTVDSTQLGLGLGAQRIKAPTRFSLAAGFLYGIQKRRDDTQTKLADQIYGDVREEYDFTERFFGYGDGYIEYNAIQRLSVRGIPEAGVGYKFWKSDEKDSSDFVAGTIGGSWVYERFFGGRDQDYFAVAFGAQASVPLPYEAKFTAGVSYLPSVSDFENDFLIRSQAALTLPLYKQVSFKLSVADDYDNTPADGTSFNYLTTIVGLSAQL